VQAPDPMSISLAVIQQDFRDANAARYLSGIGLVLLLWDHAITFADEVQLIWKARPSFAKYAFLVNRYLVACDLFTAAFFMNHFSSTPISDKTCKIFFVVSPMLGVLSIGLANILVLLRVLTLWDRDRGVVKLMTIGFLVSFAATTGTMIAAVTIFLPGIRFDTTLHMCITTESSKVLTGVWASPMVFEILVLAATCMNSLTTPRKSDTALRNALHRDGIAFFSTITILRTFNLVVAAVAPPPLILLGMFFVWAMTTLTLNRSLLNIQKAEGVRRVDLTGRQSPFGVELDKDMDVEDEDEELREEWQLE